jgi:hypothetical protein
LFASNEPYGRSGQDLSKNLQRLLEAALPPTPSDQISGIGTLWIAASDNSNGEVRLQNTSNNHTGPIRVSEGGQ